jgi:hypothetical protein
LTTKPLASALSASTMSSSSIREAGRLVDRLGAVPGVGDTSMSCSPTGAPGSRRAPSTVIGDENADGHGGPPTTDADDEATAAFVAALMSPP